MTSGYTVSHGLFDSASGSDRRRHERKRLGGHTVVVLPPDRIVRVRPLDISVGGMGIVVPIDPPAGIQFRIRTELPHGTRSTTIEATVQVTHSALSGPYDGFKVGLRFMDLDLAHRDVIEAFLRY